MWQAGTSDLALPVGPTSHIHSFLAAHTKVFQQRITVLATHIDHLPEDTSATDVALHILRCSLLAKHTYLLRYLPCPVYHAWAAGLADQVMTFLQRTLHLGEITEQQQDILSLPVGDGGFGIFQLAKERVFHHAGAILALQSSQPWYSAPDGGWVPVAQAAMDDAAKVLGKPAALSCPWPR
eukprot:805131-Amphidinium_carterae.1